MTQDERIIELYQQGLLLADIAHKLGIEARTVRTICQRLQRHGIIPKRDPKFHLQQGGKRKGKHKSTSASQRKLAQIDASVHPLYLSGMSAEGVAKQLDMTVGKVKDSIGRLKFSNPEALAQRPVIQRAPRRLPVDPALIELHRRMLEVMPRVVRHRRAESLAELLGLTLRQTRRALEKMQVKGLDMTAYAKLAEKVEPKPRVRKRATAEPRKKPKPPEPKRLDRDQLYADVLQAIPTMRPGYKVETMAAVWGMRSDSVTSRIQKLRNAGYDMTAWDSVGTYRERPKAEPKPRKVKVVERVATVDDTVEDDDTPQRPGPAIAPVFVVDTGEVPAYIQSRIPWPPLLRPYTVAGLADMLLVSPAALAVYARELRLREPFNDFEAFGIAVAFSQPANRRHAA